jgi:signal transduction histidine kinase
MHDGVGGVLTHLLLDVRENRLTEPEIEQGLQFAVDDLRNMASAIDAGNEPIDEALAMFRERMAGRLARSGIALDYRCALPIPAPSLDVRRLLSLYRLLQEGIANVVRHASATRIDLAAELGNDGAILVILSDDGMGFEPTSAIGAAGEGRGLANMRRRADQMGGRIEIESAPGRGTQLTLAIPTVVATRRKA